MSDYENNLIYEKGVHAIITENDQYKRILTEIHEILTETDMTDGEKVNYIIRNIDWSVIR